MLAKKEVKTEKKKIQRKWEETVKQLAVKQVLASKKSVREGDRLISNYTQLESSLVVVPLKCVIN